MSKELDDKPFIGPRPFERTEEDQKRFFGREEETDEIVSLIFSHQLVLIYAQSGAGKTSLFNAKIIPTLIDHGFEVFPTARLGIISADLPSFTNSDNSHLLFNLYLYNAMKSLKPKLENESLVNTSLSDFLNENFPNGSENTAPHPQLLVIDQLEEIFGLYADSRWQNQQRDFFKQISEALNNNNMLRVVFIIREDYLALLQPFEELLPEKLRARFRLERLKKRQALEAIQGPLLTTKQSIDYNFLEKLVDNLLSIRIEISGRTYEVKGEFVEPIHLQVVCKRLWNQQSLNKTIITAQDINIIGNIDMALEEFYDNAIKESANDTHIYQGDIRIWCEKNLITSSQTLSFVHKGNRETNG